MSGDSRAKVVKLYEAPFFRVPERLRIPDQYVVYLSPLTNISNHIKRVNSMQEHFGSSHVLTKDLIKEVMLCRQHSREFEGYRAILDVEQLALVRADEGVRWLIQDAKYEDPRYSVTFRPDYTMDQHLHRVGTLTSEKIIDSKRQEDGFSNTRYWANLDLQTLAAVEADPGVEHVQRQSVPDSFIRRFEAPLLQPVEDKRVSGMYTVHLLSSFEEHKENIDLLSEIDIYVSVSEDRYGRDEVRYVAKLDEYALATIRMDKTVRMVEQHART